MKSVVSIALPCVGCRAWALFESDKELSEKARVSMVEALQTRKRKYRASLVLEDNGTLIIGQASSHLCAVVADQPETILLQRPGARATTHHAWGISQ